MTRAETVRYPLLGLAGDDESAVLPLLPAGIQVLCVRRQGERLVFEAGGAEYPPEQAQGWVAGWILAGVPGQKTLGQARQELARLGVADCGELDLSAVPSSERARLLLAWWNQQLAATLSFQAQRHAKLTRELVQLRAAQEEMRTRLDRIETHVLGVVGAGRTRLLALEPAGSLGVLALAPGCEVTQTLAGGSVGLSDVAIHIAGSPHNPGAGLLEVALQTAEDEREAESWQVGGDRLREGGWIRLGLKHSLGVDARTARLRLRWSGPGALTLSQSMRHPDTRWCAHTEAGALPSALAVRTWVSPPGAALPMVSGSIAGQSGAPRCWMLGEEALSRGLSVGATAAVVEWIAEVGGLLVHPVASELSAARLDAACPVGTCLLQARVRTICDQDVRVDFALAVDVESSGPNRSPRLPALETLQASPWVEVSTHDMADIRLQLLEPLRQDSDIYLLTRWPVGSSGPRSEVLSVFTHVRVEQ